MYGVENLRYENRLHPEIHQPSVKYQGPVKRRLLLAGLIIEITNISD
jgi:hypothetical protein